MKNETKVFRKRNLNWLLVGAIILLVADPLGILGGNFSSDSYSQVRRELSKTKNAKVQLVASWNDFYSLEYNDYWRSEMSAEFVEHDYGVVLDAASLGNLFFSNYLQSRGITHILVPKSTELSGQILHKFGIRGSIGISLQPPFFNKVAESSGPYASALFRVNKSGSINREYTDPSYSLRWSGVGPEFYKVENTVHKVGMYRYEYNAYYESSPDVSWFYDQSADRPGYLEVKFESHNSYFKNINFEIELLAAYGPKAPAHVVVISTTTYLKAVKLTAGNPQRISLRISDGETIKISNATPCRVPSSFEESDTSLSKICFGVGKVRITPVIPAG